MTTFFPIRFEIKHDPGIPVEVSIDPENSIDGPIWFVVEQDKSEIVLTLSSATDLLRAITELHSNYRQMKKEF
jgi:hypothetical protein